MMEKLWDYLIILLSIGWIMEGCKTQELESNVLDVLPTDSVDYKSKHKNALIRAFMYVESKGDTLAVNPKTKATGVLQIMPIMIREANRLSGYNKYTLEDRRSGEISQEIFHVVMSKRNPDYDLAIACRLWNKRGGESYRRKVEDKYNELIHK